LIRPSELIQRKRDGGELSDDELTELVLGFTRGDVPDYQLAAFCMAVYFRGLSPRETYALTDAMVRSGETIDLQAEVGRPVADKHSTGGVGDKSSLVVGPLVAACGVPFGKMSGRGLGHTGGTLDKLESIPGFRVELSRDAFVRQVKEIGLAVIGQTAELVPADKQLYALRDVTATVENVSLIAASIMSKKIAAGANAIVLDVKVGDGAFMKSLDDARTLAGAMLELGRRADRNVVCELTDMDQPLGQAVGNAVEIREALATLRGEGPADLTELAVASAAHLVTLSDGAAPADARARAEEALHDGSALEAYDRWIHAQGGNPSEDALPRAPVVETVTSDRDGYVGSLGALAVGIAAMRLGAGRITKDAHIDHAVGIVCRRKRGDRVTAGEPVAEIHARDETAAAPAAVEVLAAYELTDEPPRTGGVILETLV
jgi:pyrimidine-nucleoside phosphorylase